MLNIKMGWGTFYYQREDYENAIKWYKKAIDIDPLVAVYYANLGVVFGILEKWQEAIEALLKALEFEPENDEYQNVLGDIYYQIESYESAICLLYKGNRNCL